MFGIDARAGKNSFVWMGPKPSINITDPKLIREVLLNHEIFQKPQQSTLGKFIIHGMVMYEGEQWSKVRKIANPAFHQDKLKVFLYSIYLSINSFKLFYFIYVYICMYIFLSNSDTNEFSLKKNFCC